MTKLNDMRRPSEGMQTLPMIVYLAVGPLFWALHLTVVYMAHTAVCALAGSPFAATTFIIAATAAIILPLVLILFNQRRFGSILGLDEVLSDRAIYEGISLFANILSLVGILWLGTAAVVLSSCVPGR